ncbi:MAG: glycosyltransferase family A protein [Candidatus Nanohaloarchaea archaeon]|nr:glycosyltransferase family A protein [Candidatus Nanohaloarchaea archaeon]
MSISVIIITKDEEKIFRALEEVKAQEPDEIIVVNDAGSSEAYTERLEAVDGIELVEVDGGRGAARNRGAAEASSDRVVFLDADCYPEEGWLETMEDALAEDDIVEGRVEYDGKRCPFNKLVENRGEEGRFLTANLGVRTAVFDEVQFDTGYNVFREDTDLGWRAQDEGFSSTFVDATVQHDAGRYTFTSFIRDRLRYVDEARFYRRFNGEKRLAEEVPQVGPVLYPVELLAAMLLVLTVAGGALTPVAWGGTIALSAALSLSYTVSKMRSNDASVCIGDLLRGVIWVPPGILAKRYAIWKGAVKYNVFVV